MSVSWWQSRLYHDAAAQNPVCRFIRTVERHVRPADELLGLLSGVPSLTRPPLGTRLRTLAHLRCSQCLWRLWRLVERRRPLSTRQAARWAWQGPGAPGVRPEFPMPPMLHRSDLDAATLLSHGVFRHLNEQRDLGREGTDWCLGPVGTGRLWTITLHYHAWAHDLAAVAAAAGPRADEAVSLFRHYVSDWIARCPLHAPGARELAWNAYAVATRLTWWIRSHEILGETRMRAWGTFAEEFLGSLWQQAAYLHDHLERDLRGNHLFRDAVGLAWAGRFFAGVQPRRWLAAAARLADQQVREQVLPDGGHFERSPMYHLSIMEDLLSLVLLLEDSALQSRLRDAWTAMAEYLVWACHPDGRIALLNDAALNSGKYTPDLMLRMAVRLGLDVDLATRRGGRWFAHTGLAVWHGQPWTVFLDAGPVGPDYQPGHAHADTLSLECSYRGRRLFVDPGTYAYDNDERRRYDRSTDAHNTVCLDEQDSSEVWHVFRVGRRARPRNVHVVFSADGMEVAAAHDGYDHLPGRPRHARKLSVRDEGSLQVIDRIDGRGRHRVCGGFLLGPEWRATPDAAGWLLSCGPERVHIEIRGPEGLALAVEHRPYHPEFGLEVEASRLTWRVEGNLPVEVATRVRDG